ncbi:hypothetical protein ETB97_001075 [Aspergillus alliaceus]|uniref:Uncharacterized protein n=1 Tax=Petromyces alliaceus TaxID=209559 RepID=A0A8H6E6Z2_PETAA|nr:hypothetical protein ETB97_001075 [Aspergillus burnettii]
MLMVVDADISSMWLMNPPPQLYVMSSFQVADQSLAGGIFNIITKFSSVIALGVSTAIHCSIRGEREIKPPLATYWYSAGLAALPIFLVLFLRPGVQGKMETGSSG